MNCYCYMVQDSEVQCVCIVVILNFLPIILDYDEALYIHVIKIMLSHSSPL